MWNGTSLYFCLPENLQIAEENEQSEKKKPEDKSAL